MGLYTHRGLIGVQDTDGDWGSQRRGEVEQSFREQLKDEEAFLFVFSTSYPHHPHLSRQPSPSTCPCGPSAKLHGDKKKQLNFLWGFLTKLSITGLEIMSRVLCA